MKGTLQLMSDSRPIIDGATISYGEGLVMDCRAIKSLEEPAPVNFLDYYDSQTAHKVAVGCARTITRAVLDERKSAKVEPTLVLPNAPRVFSFVADGLGMEPVGELCYVPSSGSYEDSGITLLPIRKAIVFRDRILQDFSDMEPEIREFASTLNDYRVESVAVHELTHLAGAQDRVFFTVDHDKLAITRIVHPGTTLEGWPDKTKGSYFEEGLGTLVANLYQWKEVPNIADQRSTKPFRTPSGVHLDIPWRNTVPGWHKYIFCGWGIERLVDLVPDAWDILMQSRKYKAEWMAARVALKSCIDSVTPGLFEQIDMTDINDLEHRAETTARIDHAARRYGV